MAYYVDSNIVRKKLSGVILYLYNNDQKIDAEMMQKTLVDIIENEVFILADGEKHISRLLAYKNDRDKANSTQL